MTQAIPSAADVSAFKQAELASNVSIALAKKSQDSAKAQGEAVISLLQAAVDLQKHTAPAEPGKGLGIDVQG
jgi:hypothetical protein